jgi:hypothetical protein
VEARPLDDCIIISIVLAGAVGLAAYALERGKLDIGLGVAGVAILVFLLGGYLTGSDPTGGGVEGADEVVDAEELLADIVAGLAAECGWVTGILVVIGVVIGVSTGESHKKREHQ